MIGLRVADRVGGHVGEDEVGRAAERLPEPVGRRIVHEVHLQDRRALDRVGGQQVDADHDRLRQPLAHDLRPAARRDAEIDDPLRALEEAEALVELDQFVGGARAIALGLGALDIGIVELALEPAGRADLAALGGLDPGPEAAARAVGLRLTSCGRRGP